MERVGRKEDQSNEEKEEKEGILYVPLNHPPCASWTHKSLSPSFLPYS